MGQASSIEGEQGHPLHGADVPGPGHGTFGVGWRGELKMKLEETAAEDIAAEQGSEPSTRKN